MKPDREEAPTAVIEARLGAVLDKVTKALAGLQFGEVRLVVHEGDVVQVERTEKVRVHRQRSP